MRYLNRWLKNFFGFSRTQANGFMVFLPLLLLLVFSAPLYRYIVIMMHKNDFSNEKRVLDSLLATWPTDDHDDVFHDTTSVPLIAFNPNRATEKELLRLGFSEKLSARIINYREKGGQFRIKSDLLKIYGLDSSFYHRLYPFIQLPEKTEAVKNEAGKERKNYPSASIVKFDINQADTSRLKKIYGIGEKLSLRIVTYRDKLGGFIDLSQLHEVYRLDSMVIQRLKTHTFIQEGFIPQKININTGERPQLTAHPYITKAVAEAIVAYRFQHGNFNSPIDLEKIQILDTQNLRKLMPYVKVED
jgi:competence protein ComEA